MTIFKSGEYDIYVRLPAIQGYPNQTGTIVGYMQWYAKDGIWYDYKPIESGAKVTAHSNIEAAYGSYHSAHGQKVEMPEGVYIHTTVGTPAAPGGT